MANRKLSFGAQVGEWVKKVKTRELAVFRESAQRVIGEMQTAEGAGGRMPVDTGFLRASLQATIGAPAGGATGKPLKRTKGQEGVIYHLDAGQVALVIAGAELGHTIYATYGAAYARRMEYGFVGQDSLGRTYNQAGKGFVRSAAQKWPQIVAAVSAELKTRIEG